MATMTKLTVSVDWLFEHLENPNLVILDASIKRVTGGGNTSISEKYIPKSLFFDLNGEMSDKNSPYSHTLLPDDAFVENLKKLGIDNESVIVVYDNQGVYSSPRAFYMIKNIGHEQVYVLDGGLPEWEAKGYPITASLNQSEGLGNINQHGTHDYFFSSGRIVQAMDQDGEVIIDARSAGRFTGHDPEPRQGLKSGHIPGSVNLPFEAVLINGKFQDTDRLKSTFENLKVENKTLIFSCGSGVTSCIIAMAAELSGYHDVHVYDGSWTEWADENNTYPVVR